MNWAALFNEDTWRFINTFAPWLSALGTFAAVAVSLRLASKSRRVDLKVSVSLQTLVGQGMPRRNYVTISVVNLGGREATVTGIGWRMGFVKKQHFFQVPGVPHLSSKIPIRLQDGETAMYLMPDKPEPGTDAWTPRMRQQLGRYPALTVLSLRGEVFTSVGKRFSVRADKSVRDLLRGKNKEAEEC
jgi:hypothetical protein